ncbi:unnamed protein product [Lampetra fluviatilis]
MSTNHATAHCRRGRSAGQHTPTSQNSSKLRHPSSWISTARSQRWRREQGSGMGRKIPPPFSANREPPWCSLHMRPPF